jgi:O-antigen ligase
MATWALAAACVLGALLVDPGAEAAFDAPKRLATLVAIAVAALAVLAGPRRSTPVVSIEGRLARALAAAGVLGMAVAAVLSPHHAASFDATRVALFGVLLLPLGASAATEGRGSRIVVGAVLAAALVNALVSLLQAGGLFQPFAIEAVGGRTATGAFIGNEGQLALTLALAAVLALGILLGATRPAPRAASAAGLVLLVAALLVNGTVTALAATAAGVGVLVAMRLGRRAVVPALAVAALLVAVAAVSLPLRGRVVKAVADVRAGAWDDLVSNRLGPWAAALEMARERPLTGFGPGSFPSEFVLHRLRAEIRYRTRFVIPRLTSSYSEAHDEYLQALAECGVPAALAMAGAMGTLLVGLARRGGEEATLLLAFLVTGAVAALMWFPLQRPASSVPLLLAAGRAWRVLG